MLAILTSFLVTFWALQPAADDWAASERLCLGEVIQLTDPSMGFEKAGEAYFSPDGKDIIFQAVPNGEEYYQIYVMAVADRKPKMVSTGKGECTCAYFHPKRDTVLFASSHLDPRLASSATPEEPPGYQREGSNYRWSFNAHMDIFEGTRDGRILRRLTDSHGYDAEGAYDRSGGMIAFSSQRSGDLEIFVMKADGSEPRQLTRSKGYDGGPFISPDAKRVIFRADRKGNDLLQLFVIDIDGSNERQLTDNEHVNWGPYWHPNSRTIIYATSAHGHHNYELYLMNIKSGVQKRVTYRPGFDGLPTFSTDGKRLLWTAKRGPDNTSQVFMTDFKLPDGF
jgi:Tol biopolymer transport system component